MTATLNRRGFLKLTGATGAALVLGFRLDDETAPIHNMRLQNGEFVPNAYIAIAPDGTITLQMHRSEMGQGTRTSMTMIMVEELEANWDDLRLENAPPDRAYGDQVTGGSQSVSGSYSVLRMAGATARTMLITAAAQTWDVDPAELRAEASTVIHDATGNVLSYGDLVETAAQLEAPGRSDVQLKNPADFHTIGQSHGNYDNLDLVTGRVQFTSDMHWPGLQVAVVAYPPALNARIEEYDTSAAEAVPGVTQVIALDNNRALAVLAENTPAALKGRDALIIKWDEGSTDINSDNLRDQILERFSPGDDENELVRAYTVGYMAHAPMESMVCIADAQADHCEVWAPTQDRQDAHRVARRVAGTDVTLHVPLIGGAFGRRLQNDYVSEAVMISKAAGVPVKLFWTRQDDIRNDFYHPLTARQVSASFDAPTRIQMRSADAHGVPTGAWRSVGQHPDAFAHECFVDELAEKVGRDTLDLQLELNDGSPRAAVLQLAAEKASWGEPLPNGVGRGIAVHSTFGVTHVAQVVEATLEGQRVRVQRVVCAVDCGQIVNPDGVIAQMESGIIFALTAALYGTITIKNGAVQQSNFHDYALMRFEEAPEIDVYLVQSDRSPTGIGEMGVPPTAPALCNALYQVTGQRLYRLPVTGL